MKNGKKKSQEQIVLDHLETHGSITSFEAFMNYYITRLSGRIHELRMRGYEIETDMQYKNGKHYAVYRKAW